MNKTLALIAAGLALSGGYASAQTAPAAPAAPAPAYSSRVITLAEAKTVAAAASDVTGSLGELIPKRAPRKSAEKRHTRTVAIPREGGQAARASYPKFPPRPADWKQEPCGQSW